MSAPAYAKVEQAPDDAVRVLEEDLPVAIAVVPAENPHYSNDSSTPVILVPPSDTTPDAPPLRVRVYAPCYLPPNYELTVQTNNGEDMFTVLAPDTGVYGGQVFEAERFAREPVTGRWSDGLCDCFSTEGVCVFFAACCCSGTVYAALMERLRLDWLATPVTVGDAYKGTFGIVCTIWFVMMFYPIVNIFTMGLLTLVVWTFPFYFCWVKTRTRMIAREKYFIHGSCCEDCCLTFWCSCCAALQMHRHMKRSGDSPRPFKTVGHAEIV